MNNCCNRIQHNFNKASSSYERVAHIQKQAASSLIHQLKIMEDFNPRTILDLGTGTGYIPEFLIPLYPNAFFYLNDIAQDMLSLCAEKFSNYSNITYVHGDMRVLNNDVFDVVISNLALQWLDNLWEGLRFFYTKSSKFFAFSIVVNGTFQEWKDLTKQYQDINFQNYPTVKELINYCCILNKSGPFSYWIVDYPLLFNSPLEFMQYLKKLGAAAVKNPMGFKNLKQLLAQNTQPLTTSYKIFFGILRKID